MSVRGKAVTVALLAALAVLLGSLGFASASRVNVTAKDVGAGVATTVTRCDTSTTLSYRYAYDTTRRATTVDQVTVTDIDTACRGAAVQVRLSTTTAGVEKVLVALDGTVPATAGTDVTFTLPTQGANPFDPTTITSTLVVV